MPSPGADEQRKQIEKLGQIIAGFLHCSGVAENQPVYITGDVMKEVTSRGKSIMKIGGNPEDPGSVIIQVSWERHVVAPSLIVPR